MSKKQTGFSIVGAPIVLAIILAIGAAGSVVYKNQHRTNYQNTVSSFVSDFQNKDKAGADSLESARFKSYVKKLYGNESFYDSCQQIGQLCTPLFSASFINKASKTYGNYKSSDGVSGKQITYVLKQTISGTQAGGQNCSSSSVSKLTIAVIPSGNTWLVDNVNPSVAASATLCPATNSNTSVGSSPPTPPPSTPSKATTPNTRPSTSNHNTTTPPPIPAPSAPSPTVTVSDDGCFVAAWGSPGMTLNVAVRTADSHAGGDATYTLPSSGTIEEPSGGYQGEITTGTLYQSGTQVATDSTTITAASCPPGGP